MPWFIGFFLLATPQSEVEYYVPSSLSDRIAAFSTSTIWSELKSKTSK